MNKLDTSNNGGMPIELDDLEWLDAAYRDAWYGFISAFGITAPTSFKLSGCVVTVVGNIFTTTAGYLCLNGEILKVDAHSITTTALHTAKWILEETYDITGNEQFFNTNSYDTYQKRRAVLADTVPIIPINYMPFNAKYLYEIIATYTLLPAEENWHIVGGTGEPAFENSWVNFGSDEPVLKFKKDAYGWIHIEGTIKSGVVGIRIFTLPAGYIPTTYKRFYILVQDAAYVLKGCELHITPSGYVILNSADSSDNRRISLTVPIFKVD